MKTVKKSSWGFRMYVRSHNGIAIPESIKKSDYHSAIIACSVTVVLHFIFEKIWIPLIGEEYSNLGLAIIFFSAFCSYWFALFYYDLGSIGELISLILLCPAVMCFLFGVAALLDFFDQPLQANNTQEG